MIVNGIEIDQLKMFFNDFQYPTISITFFANLLRSESYPTLYDDLQTKISIDVGLFRLAALFLASFVSFLVILPGFRGKKKFSVVLRWSTSLVILFFIIYCNIMPYWEYGSVHTRMPYKFGTDQQINASLEVNIGLHGINVTLNGHRLMNNEEYGDLLDPNPVYFNEYFHWTWSQGKPGFGSDSGEFQKDYRSAQFQGLPYPILWVAETFTIDYGQIRIGRYYRQAGWFAHIFLWTSIPLFILSNILFQMVIYYGSLFIIFTGISLLSANVVVICLRSSIPFTLAFENDFLVFHYSWCYYINFINGVLCILIGIITLIADLRLPDETAEFFGNDVLQSYEDYFADPTQDIQKVDEFTDIQSKSDNEVLLRKKPSNNKVSQKAITTGLKKKTFNERFSRFQKSTIRKANNHLMNDEQNKSTESDEVPLYENFRQFSKISEEDKTENEL